MISMYWDSLIWYVSFGDNQQLLFALFSWKYFPFQFVVICLVIVAFIYYLLVNCFNAIWACCVYNAIYTHMIVEWFSFWEWVKDDGGNY